MSIEPSMLTPYCCPVVRVGEHIRVVITAAGVSGVNGVTVSHGGRGKRKFRHRHFPRGAARPLLTTTSTTTIFLITAALTTIIFITVRGIDAIPSPYAQR